MSFSALTSTNQNLTPYTLHPNDKRPLCSCFAILVARQWQADHRLTSRFLHLFLSSIHTDRVNPTRRKSSVLHGFNCITKKIITRQSCHCGPVTSHQNLSTTLIQKITLLGAWWKWHDVQSAQTTSYRIRPAQYSPACAWRRQITLLCAICFAPAKCHAQEMIFSRARNADRLVYLRGACLSRTPSLSRGVNGTIAWTATCWPLSPPRGIDWCHHPTHADTQRMLCSWIFKIYFLLKRM